MPLGVRPGVRYADHMDEPLTAHDLWLLVQKLPHDEQVRLARLALRAAASGRDSRAVYAAQPPNADEFGTDEDPLAWEAEGWEQLGAPR